jgi:anti-sigma-K factor RskA
MVEAQRGGALRLASLNPQPVDADRVLQLWALPQGATAPTSLGLIPAAGEVTVTPQTLRAQPGMLIEISLEPPGGSTTGRPTGPVLFIGRLSAAGSS